METALIIIATVIGAFVVLNIIARMKMKNLPTVADNQNILTLTEKNFQQQTKSKVVIVDFWAAWCAPCRMMAPVLNDVADALPGNMQVGKINVEVEKALAQKFNVRSIPTLILFKDGKEVNRFVGVKTKDFLLKEMNKFNV